MKKLTIIATLLLTAGAHMPTTTHAHPRAAKIQSPHATEQFKSTMKMFKKQCHKDCNGPLCKPLTELTKNIETGEITEDHAHELASRLKNHCCQVKELAHTIQQDMHADPIVCANIKRCREIGDQESYQKFEKHLRAKTRNHCGVECLFSKEKKDCCMAAAFVAAVECLDCPH